MLSDDCYLQTGMKDVEAPPGRITAVNERNIYRNEAGNTLEWELL